jgi:hypothetical protein
VDDGARRPSDKECRSQRRFSDRQAAEAMLAEVVGDEPERRDVLHVERIQLFTGTAN